MLTDEDVVNELREWFEIVPRNLTPEQWQEIEDTLPSIPTHEASMRFVLAVNQYWDEACNTPPHTQVRLVSGAINDLTAADEKIRAVGSRTSESQKLLAGLESLHGLAEEMFLRAIHTRAPGCRHDFLDGALWFWSACGGKVRASRQPLPPRKPSGPAIRYLQCVCRIVM
jgi:hypothetical protein